MSIFTAGLPSFLLQSLRRMNIETPTNVQDQAIPVILEGKDALITAHTGSGKTLAYLVPIIIRIANGCNKKILILAPTRELATQISAVAIACLNGSAIRVANLIGGQSMVLQLKQLQKDPQIIVGTPGRVYDHIDRGTLELNDVSCFVLDEMDRMLDLGFSQQIEEIEQYINKDRQTLMFSATLPGKTLRLVERYLKDYIRIEDGSLNKPAPKIDHTFERTTNQDKYPKMLEQITKREGTIIIFVNRKIDAEKIAGKLKDEGLRVDSIHGDLRQNVRDRILQKFRDQKIRIMVGTDVVARGLDVKHIQHVINYDLPMCSEDYLHRIGRTGRAGESGSAFSLVGPQDNLKWRAIQRLIDPTSVPAGSGKDFAPEREFRRSNSRGGGGRSGFGGGKPRSESGFKDRKRFDSSSRDDYQDRSENRRGGFMRSQNDHSDAGFSRNRGDRNFGGQDKGEGFGSNNNGFSSRKSDVFGSKDRGPRQGFARPNRNEGFSRSNRDGGSSRGHSFNNSASSFKPKKDPKISSLD